MPSTIFYTKLFKKLIFKLFKMDSKKIYFKYNCSKIKGRSVALLNENCSNENVSVDKWLKREFPKDTCTFTIYQFKMLFPRKHICL